ncbi:TPA: serine/threonine protein kinase [Pseudomonas aeruginosa]|nr:serine/threonine protein kinase [Pseudomonas aeruginosa]
MDAVKAKIWEEQLFGKNVGVWRVGKYINNGKSAAVFEAFDEGGEKVAIKIFDDELIERYGDKVQLARIERELELIGSKHPNMVSILGGGYDEVSKNHYIVMEYLPGENLKDCLDKVPMDKVPYLIAQLASAAKFLEERSLVHRDIKPENIVVLDDYSRLVLLDFGVIRLVGRAGLTDDDGVQQFVGTLQYSSPEFLLRNEVDSEEGWRALTFYQIGGVMHDLVMRRRLFEESSTPYPRLVNAVQNEAPVIEGGEVLHRVIHIARCCLLKLPELRVKYVSWDDFLIENLCPVGGVSSKQKVLDKLLYKRAQNIEARELRPETDADKFNFLGEVKEFIAVGIRNIRSETLPPVSFLSGMPCSGCVAAKFAASPDIGLSSGLIFSVHVSVQNAVEKAVTLSFFCSVDDSFVGQGCSGFEVFYEGVYDVGGVLNSLEDALYRSVDKFQE